MLPLSVVLVMYNALKISKACQEIMKLTILLLITISLFSCSKNSNSSSSPLMPLTVGNRWHFNIYTYSDSASMIYTATSVSSSVTDTISYNGHIYYKYSDTTNKPIAYRNADNNTVEQYDGINPPSIAYKRVSKDSDAVNGTFYGVTTLQDVNDVNCIRNTSVIINGLTRDSINNFICPGIGLVRTEHWYKNAANNFGYYLLTRQDLTSYNLNE